MHPDFWKKTTLEAFKNDPFRIVIELIKNAADSYTRLEKKSLMKPPFDIYVKFFCGKKKAPYVEVLDHAEGMDSRKLKEALKYGTQTSMGEDTKAITSAEKGIGLKDAMMALKDNWLITIRDGLINERNKHPDFVTGIGREDEKVAEEEREELGIPINGTIVQGGLPKYFRERRFSTVCRHLQQHFLMRKLLQKREYRIHAIDSWTKKKILLKHSSPETEKLILKDAFKIKYNGKDFNVDLHVNRSKAELSQGKPFGESGLLFFYGRYSVMDFTFCRFDRHPSFARLFGEVRMEVEPIIRDPNESPLVDEKRRGLDQEHPFNKKLFNEINRRLDAIQEEEEASRYTFDEYTMKDILKELNKIYREIKGRGLPPEPPIKPDTFAFYPVYVSLKEYEPKTVFLIINSSIVSDELNISIQSTNPDITVSRSSIEIKRKKRTRQFILRQVQLYSEKARVKGEIVAIPRLDPYLTPERMGVEVLENPIFSPTNAFAFVPDKTTIVDDGQKKVDLCMDRGIVRGSNAVTFASSGPVSSPGRWSLPDPANLEKYVIKNIAKISIPIKTRGKDHIGEKARIRASYEDKDTYLDITVVPEPSIAGLFRKIRWSAKDTKKIAHFIKHEGILEIYYKHPLIQKYMKKRFRTRGDFLVFIADTLTREALKAFVSAGIEDNSSRFLIFDLDHPEGEIEDHIIREYHEEGAKMHELFLSLAKKIKLGAA